MGTKRETVREWFRRLQRNANQGVQPQVADAAPVDAQALGRERIRMGKRTRGKKRETASPLFAGCEVVPICGLAVCCPRCGVRALYEIRPSENPARWVLIRDEVPNSWPINTLASRCEENPDQCAARALNGLDIRALAGIGAAYYVVARNGARVPARKHQPVDGTGDLFDNRAAAQSGLKDLSDR